MQMECAACVIALCGAAMGCKEVVYGDLFNCVRPSLYNDLTYYSQFCSYLSNRQPLLCRCSLEIFLAVRRSVGLIDVRSVSFLTVRWSVGLLDCSMFDRSRVGPGRHQEVATWLSLEENANEVVFIKLDSSLNDEVR